MPQAVNGFLTTDGAFHMSLHKANRHEAAIALKDWCESQLPQVKFDRLLIIIEAQADTIRDYINAHEASLKEDHTQEDTSSTGGDQTDDPLGDAYVASVEQLTARGHEPVPHMGDRTQPEGVFKRGKKYGPRSRGDDA